MISTQCIHRRQAHWVTALEESETTGEPSDPSHATIATTTIPTLYKTDAALFSIKQVHHYAVPVCYDKQATATTIPTLFKTDAAVFSIRHVHHYAVPV